MDLTPSQRLAMAEATARRWFRRLEALSVTDVGDEHFSYVHSQWMGAEQAVTVLRERAAAPGAGAGRVGPSGDH